jgi:histidinol dehydrogenase
MSKIIELNDNNRELLLKEFASSSQILSDVSLDVSNIISAVKNDGDEALFALTKKFDGFDVNEQSLKFSDKEIDDAYNRISNELRESIKLSYERVRRYHLKQKPVDEMSEDETGSVIGWKYYSLESVGIYVPGGLASYPSSLLMSATIAKVAGVLNISVVTPCSGGEYNDAVLAVAKVIGVKDIYKVGGAQAIAALSFGTDSIKPVCKIVGPGNAYVAEAKRQVFGHVGIDSVAGPSEILIISDNKTNPKWVAMDLLSQAEHDENARSILICDDFTFAQEVEQELLEILEVAERREIARKSWDINGRIFVVSDLKKEGIVIANEIAAEHLEILTDDAESYVDLLYNAGCLFVGRYSCESIGDYMAGPSHVLPTSGTARYASGLSVFDFMRRSSIVSMSKQGFAELADNTVVLAESEGLECHANSVRIRNEK